MNPQLNYLLEQGIVAFENGHFERAESILVKIIRVDSKNCPALHVLGLIKASQKKYKDATELLGKAAKIDPKDPSIRYNLAKALDDCGAHSESIQHHKKAIELAPNNPNVWLNYGKSLSSLNSFEEALSVYEKALAIQPEFAEAFLNKGATLKELGRYDEAIGCADKALRINPNLAEAWSNKGFVLKELRQYISAVNHFEKALIIDPTIDWLHGDLLHAKMKICDWSDMNSNLEKITSRVMNNQKVISPFPILALTDDLLLHRQCAESYIKNKYPFRPELGQIPRGLNKTKIRVGYFSADLYNHATAYLIAELFELHDKFKFEFFASRSARRQTMK